MFFTREALAANSRIEQHFQELRSQRNIWNAHHGGMVANMRQHMTPEMLTANTLSTNANSGIAWDYWKDIDNQVVTMRDLETGMEIVNDLLAVQTVLPIGKTARLYNIVGDIADDVKVTMDGQAPYSFDSVDYENDGDPIPVFTAGYGVNWRHATGTQGMDIDIVLDSQEAKLRQYYKKLVAYALDGDANISVKGYAGQGLRNHRNTKKLDLGGSGANIDLTTATFEDLITFFGKGAFGALARANRVDAYDVMWVSHEIWANMSQPYLVELNSGTNGALAGTMLGAAMPFMPVREVKPTYSLSGNEFIAYQRRRDVVSPLVGMTTGTVPLPRPMPQSNYNFQIMGAMGINIKIDSEGRGGVVYASEIT